MKQDGSKTSSEKPLLGAVLCCTSITPEDRTRLAEYAEHMGAEHKLDLTSDVTHLLVGSTDTPKYQYVAKEREDVKVLRPEWVEAVRECWMEDRPLDMNALEAEYRVPTLAGLKICITGFEDLTFRSQLQKNVIANGGEYTGDLTKDVTHLIAARPEGKKYEYARQWQKKVVSLQWYKDTLQRGMQLDETSYDPTRPVEQQGIGAWNKQDPKDPKVGKRTRGDQPVQEPVRKLRRTASAKLSSQNESMWGDIVGHTSQQTNAARPAVRPSKSVPDISGRMQLGQEETPRDHAETITANSGGFLDGLRFRISLFDDKKAGLVGRTLKAAGAEIIESQETRALSNGDIGVNLYLIVPHQTRSEQIPKLGCFAEPPVIVTELWLERCMLQKAWIPPHKYPLGGIIARINPPDIMDFTVNATGFQSIETLHIAKTVALTGAKYSEVFSPNASVLVCNSMNINKQKLFHAKQWNIPTVSEDWLCRFLTEGSIPNFERHLIKDEDDENNDLEAELKQKRTERNPRRPKDDGGSKGAGAGRPTSLSTHARSQQSTTSMHEQSSEKGQDRDDMSEHRKRGQSRQQQHNYNPKENTALQEISPNSPSRRDQTTGSPPKKSLFRTYDGASSLTGPKVQQPRPIASGDGLKAMSSHKSVQDAASINSAIEDLLNMKARAKAMDKARQAEPKEKNGKLLGRALSNLSNASHGSRASSVDSLNTDGLGSEIAPPSGRSEGGFGSFRRASLQSRAQSKPSNPSAAGLHGSLYNSTSVDLSDPHLLRDEPVIAEEGPQLTQLGYEDSEEAIIMREKLAEKRRARSRLGQKEGDAKPEDMTGGQKGKETPLKQRQKPKQVIKDDETLITAGWGGGGRTRAKNRSVDFADF